MLAQLTLSVLLSPPRTADAVPEDVLLSPPPTQANLSVPVPDASEAVLSSPPLTVLYGPEATLVNPPVTEA